MSIDLPTIVEDFAACIKLADARRPQAVNVRSKQPFQAGIGPHSEAQVIKLVTDEMILYQPTRYGNTIAVNVPYPESPRQKCDICIGHAPLWDWAIEVKMLRFLGDNGKLNDNILMHILSPYPEHRSALTDCVKLVRTRLGQSKAVLIYGFEHEEWPLDLAIEAFEVLAKSKIGMSRRYVAEFDDLIHPIHKRGKVFGWQLYT
ncbi:MAG: hypothetical protein ACFLMY_02770 [Candidatus Brachytrichaceae bacterium NZ_4S206]|jgi:hypothetical protein